MPTGLNDVDTSGVELYFASDLEGETFILRESAVYEAEEVQEETNSGTPEFGRWLPVIEADEDGNTEAEGWAVAVGELVEELQDMEADAESVPFTITRCQKSGPGQTDPYEVNTVAHDGTDDQQSGLDGS